MSDEQAYIYCADIYCEACADDIRKRLTAEGKRPKNWQDERTFDSDEYPKGPYDNGGGESDGPQHCGSHDECLDPTIIDGQKCGHFLENPLTTHGVEYLLEQHMQNTTAVTEFWMEFYSEEVESLLKSKPQHPYHKWVLRHTLQRIVDRVRVNLNGEDEGTDDPTGDMLEWILDVAAEHDIYPEEPEDDDDS